MMPALLQAKQQLDDIQELYWKLQSFGVVTQLNSTLEDLVWASDIVRSRAFAVSTKEGVQPFLNPHPPPFLTPHPS